MPTCQADARTSMIGQKKVVWAAFLDRSPRRCNLLRTVCTGNGLRRCKIVERMSSAATNVSLNAYIAMYRSHHRSLSLGARSDNKASTPMHSYVICNYR